MLCPEVWRFPINERKTFHKFGGYDSKAKQTLQQTIKSSPFNNVVSLILPGHETVPESIKDLIATSDYYLVRDLKLSELVRKDFIEIFIKQGKLFGTSLSDKHINNDEDVFLISPEGKLTLLISRDLYQTIGLEGHPADNSKRNKDRFEIIIDLKKENTSGGSKSYKRLQNAFLREEIETFNFHLFWEPLDNSICPSSVAKFFNDIGYEVEQHSLRSMSILRDDVRLPKEILSQPQIDVDLTNSLLEYLAILTLRCDLRSTAEELNSYKVDPDLFLNEPTETKAVIFHCRGLITSDFISKLIDFARQSVESGPLVLTVTGYDKTSSTGSASYTTVLSDKNFLLSKA